MYMESLAKTYEKYKDNGFEVYTVSCDTNTEAWKKLVAEKDFGRELYEDLLDAKLKELLRAE